MGVQSMADLQPSMVTKRVTSDRVMTYEVPLLLCFRRRANESILSTFCVQEQYPRMSPGELLGPDGLVRLWAAILQYVLTASACGQPPIVHLELLIYLMVFRRLPQTFGTASTIFLVCCTKNILCATTLRRLT